MGDLTASMLPLLGLQMEDVFLTNSSTGDEVFCVKDLPNDYFPVRIRINN